MKPTQSTGLHKSESLLSAEEIEDAIVTPEIIHRYRERFPKLGAAALIDTIEADFCASYSSEGLPPFYPIGLRLPDNGEAVNR
jgi:hypothetical protein